MTLLNKDISNILSIHFEDVSKYLDYNDYYSFYKIYASKNIESLIRKCLYCHKNPICPININYEKFYQKCFINSKNIKLICAESIKNPICYTCCMENWINNFNKLSLKTRLNKGFICPYKCCNVKINEYKYGLGKYKENLINFDVHWKYMDKVKYHKCNYCNIIFRNKTHYDIYKHYKYSTCRIIIKKLLDGNKNINLNSYDYSSSDSDSSYISDYEENYYN